MVDYDKDEAPYHAQAAEEMFRNSFERVRSYRDRAAIAEGRMDFKERDHFMHLAELAEGHAAAWSIALAAHGANSR